MEGVAGFFTEWGAYYVMLQNGEVWAWGTGWSAQFGETRHVDMSAPVQIAF